MPNVPIPGAIALPSCQQWGTGPCFQRSKMRWYQSPCLGAQMLQGWSQLGVFSHGWYPLVNQHSDIESGPVEIVIIVDLPINSMVDLSIVFCMFTRGYLISSSFFGHNGYHQQPPWKRRPRSLRSSSVAHASPSQASGVPRGLNLDWKTTSQSDPWNDNEYIRGITLW